MVWQYGGFCSKKVVDGRMGYGGRKQQNQAVDGRLGYDGKMQQNQWQLVELVDGRFFVAKMQQIVELDIVVECSRISGNWQSWWMVDFCSKKAVDGRLGYGGIIGNGVVVWWFLQQKGSRLQNWIWLQNVVELVVIGRVG